MSTVDMFVEKAIRENADNGIVDNISRATPMLATMPTKQTNKGRENVYEVYTDVDAIPQTELDAPLQSVNAESRLGREGLLHWSAKQEIGVGKLNELETTKEAYFAEKAGRVFRKTGQNFESSTIYSIQDKAIANNKVTKGAEKIFKDNRVVSLGGSTANKQFSIQIVTWDGDTVTGLYNNASFGGIRQGMFEVGAIGSGTYLNPNDVEVYGASYRMDAGVQLADPQLFTSIVNIENSASIVDDIKTAKLDYYLSLQIEQADPSMGQCYIYMRPELQVALSAAFKDNMNETSFKIGDFDSRILTWNGIPIISTRNMFAGTEPVKTL